MHTVDERWQFFYAQRLEGPCEHIAEYSDKVSLYDYYKIATNLLERAIEGRDSGDFTNAFIYSYRVVNFLAKVVARHPDFRTSTKYKKIHETAFERGFSVAEDCKVNIKETLALDIKLEEEREAQRLAQEKADAERGDHADYLRTEEPVLLIPGEQATEFAAIVEQVDRLEVEAAAVVVNNDGGVPLAEDGKGAATAVILDEVSNDVIHEGLANVVTINVGDIDDNDHTVPIFVPPDGGGQDSAIVLAEDKPINGRSEFGSLYLQTNDTAPPAAEIAVADSTDDVVITAKLVSNDAKNLVVTAPVVPEVTGSVPVPTAKIVPSVPPPSAKPPMPPAQKDHGKQNSWRVDDKCDILDRFPSRHTGAIMEQWRTGKVVACRGNRLKVHFDGWSDTFDIWLSMPREKTRIASYGKHTKRYEMARMSKEDKFIVGLQSKNYSIYKMRGDGNCLFRAVAHQIYGDPERHAELRRMVCDHMGRHPEQFAEVLGALYPGGFQGYLNAMRRPCYQGSGEWGGDPEIRVMEELIDRPFELWDVSHGPEEPSSIHLEGSLPDNMLDNVEPVRISYHGKNHYNSVIYNKHKHMYPLDRHGIAGTSRIRNFRLATEAKDAQERARASKRRMGYK